MNSNPNSPTSVPDPLEEDIRAYAYHLYEQSGRQPGHELEHWLEATACIQANIPQRSSHARLHHHLAAQTAASTKARGFTMPPSDAALVPDAPLPRVRGKGAPATKTTRGSVPEIRTLPGVKSPTSVT